MQTQELLDDEEQAQAQRAAGNEKVLQVMQASQDAQRGEVGPGFVFTDLQASSSIG
jgi:hypothetical protein